MSKRVRRYVCPSHDLSVSPFVNGTWWCRSGSGGRGHVVIKPIEVRPVATRRVMARPR